MPARDTESAHYGPEANLMAARAMDELDANIVVLDVRGIILYANKGWRDFAANNPLPDGSLPRNVAIGSNYLSACRDADGPSSANSVAVIAGICSVLEGKKRFFSCEYPCHSPTKQRWFAMTVKAMRYTRPRQIVVTHIDITGTRLTEMESLAKQRELGLALLQLQEMATKITNLIDMTEPVSIDSPLVKRGQSGHACLEMSLDAQLDLLSDRELEVLGGLVRGERNSAIADRLNLSRKSVSTYRSRVLEKLNVGTNADLVALLYGDGLIHKRLAGNGR